MLTQCSSSDSASRIVVAGLLAVFSCIATVGQEPLRVAQPVRAAQPYSSSKVLEVAAPNFESSEDGTRDSAADQDPAERRKEPRRGSLVVVPVPISSPAIGSGIVPVFGYIFPLNKRDKVSPPSIVGAVGLITNNGSRASAVAAQLYFGQNTYRVTTGFVRGNINYNLYGIGVIAGNAGRKLPLEQSGEGFFGEVLRRVKGKFFVGPRFMTGHSVIMVRQGGDNSVSTPPDAGLQTTLRAIGLRVNRDTRPNHFYPASGTVFDFTADFFSQGIGSKYSFQSYQVTFNKYWSLRKNQVLAYNATFCGTGGEAPFYATCLYGSNNELRGYTTGQYIDRYMLATQLEYRLTLPWRLGLVGFGGIGEVFPGADKIFRANSFLPAGGAGARFNLSKQYHVNLRADVGFGKNGHTFAIGIGEAF